MARLIDADALKRYIDCGHLRPPDEICLSEMAVVQMVDRMPTIEAKPVCYGHWILKQEGKLFKKEFYSCSNCGSRSPILYKFNYCFNCGATMKE